MLANLGMKSITQAELTALVHPSAKAFDTYYRFCRDDIFREAKWPFATVQKSLTKINAEWSSSTAYVVDDFVEYEDIIYISIQAGTNKQPDTETAYWTAVTSAIVLLPWSYAYLYSVNYDIDDLTAWNSGTTYTAGQTVKYNNVAYLSLLGSNLNKTPSSQPTYWAAQTNVATVWHVFDESTADKKDEQDFAVFLIPGSTDRRIICTNLDDAYMEYTFIVNDTTLWDAKFVMAMGYRLAASAALLLPADPKKGEGLMNAYNAIIAEAKRISATERIKKPSTTSGYQKAR